ncbi:hypothetical protein HYH03_005136 [Edaphochlamys debaryana]|uniref:Uncharacterized protein n=1 Tax=Edaphochlamys debaryana TaxID=47281 RepID=A0A836C2I6_9CHLO|nr:hypothetical protein HYH03_005136 [Edaphochlamys debaryana]|eukprot:KAG2496723.1 hypothetical protein HYH03_005136 [Edaphochlamys debaryana]
MFLGTKAALPAPPVPAPETKPSESTEPARVRVRKSLRTASTSLGSLSSSPTSSDTDSLSSLSSGERKPLMPQQRHAVVIDHQGAGKVVHKPDGTVVWEPAPESADGAGRRGPAGPLDLVKQALAVSGAVVVASSAAAGMLAVHHHVGAATRNPYNVQRLTTRQLTTAVAHTVTAYVAGTATGMVVGPLLAVRTVGGALLRPLLLGVALQQGVTRLARWRSGVAGMVRRLQSPDPARVLAALRDIIAAAKKLSPRFAKEFHRLAGVEALLQRLSLALPDCPLLHLIVQALAELCKDDDCRDAMVAAGGVPRLVALLGHPSPAVSRPALTALGTLTDHTLGLEAIREAGGLAPLVSITAAAVAPPPGLASAAASDAPSSSAAAALAPPPPVSADKRSTLRPAVKLLQALSLDPASKLAIGDAGGVAALLEVISRSEPRSEAAADAVAALHNCLRGCPDNQRALAALPHASEVLRAALAGCGPCWAPAKGDLHALLNVLARLQGVQEAGGFVVIQSQVAAAAAKEGAPAPASATAVPGTAGAVAARA